MNLTRTGESTGSARTGSSILLMLLALVLAACDTGTPSTGTPGKLNVVATTTQIRSMAQAVAGDLADVSSILTPGTDAHNFEPKPSDVQNIGASALVLKNGIGLDDWIDEMIASAGGERPLVVVTGDIPVRAGDVEEPAGDPHVWFNVSNAITMTAHIRDALIEVDPSHAGQYRTNAEEYAVTLRELDLYIRDQVATVPQEQRKMVTNHDVFGYFIEAYDLTFIGSIIPSMSTEAQPSAQDVAELIEKTKAENVRAIFLESSINPQLAQQIGKDAGVKVIDDLYGDSLGEEGTPGATYEGMMRYNTYAIVNGLK